MYAADARNPFFASQVLHICFDRSPLLFCLEEIRSFTIEYMRLS